MLDQPRRRRQGVELETNTAPDQLNDDLHRRTEQQTSSDSTPAGKKGDTEDEPASGGSTSNGRATSDDYQREIDRLDESVRARSR